MITVVKTSIFNKPGGLLNETGLDGDECEQSDEHSVFKFNDICSSG